jgi:hypothetical protein
MINTGYRELIGSFITIVAINSLSDENKAEAAKLCS